MLSYELFEKQLKLFKQRSIGDRVMEFIDNFIETKEYIADDILNNFNDVKNLYSSMEYRNNIILKSIENGELDNSNSYFTYSDILKNSDYLENEFSENIKDETMQFLDVHDDLDSFIEEFNEKFDVDFDVKNFELFVRDYATNNQLISSYKELYDDILKSVEVDDENEKYIHIYRSILLPESGVELSTNIKQYYGVGECWSYKTTGAIPHCGIGNYELILGCRVNINNVDWDRTFELSLSGLDEHEIRLYHNVSVILDNVYISENNVEKLANEYSKLFNNPSKVLDNIELSLNITKISGCKYLKLTYKPGSFLKV